MNITLRKAVSLLVCAILLIAALPLSVNAAEIVSSGTCGDNVSWTIDSEGLLTISGIGDTKNYSAFYNGPFYNNKKITDVIVESGVTSLGNYILSSITNLKSVVLPEGLTSIGNGAFSYNSLLEEVTLPQSLVKISQSAFFRCKALSTILIPNSVTEIGQNAFAGCTSLNSVTLSERLTAIEGTTFDNCAITEIIIPASVASVNPTALLKCESLLSINVDEANENYCSVNGILYDKTQSTVITVPKGVGGKVTVSENVTFIGTYAFRACSAVTEIVIPNGPETIDSYSFSDCASLAAITIPASVNSIKSRAFSDCSSLELIYFLGTRAQWNSVTKSETGNEDLMNAAVHCTDDTDHFWNSGVITAEATCVTPGERTYTCPCGAQMTTQTGTDPSNHVNTVAVPETFSTCSENGYTAGVFCNDCGKFVLGHRIKALADHANTEIRNAREADCVNDGYTGDEFCLDCGELISEGETIPSSGHTESEAVTENETEATCTENGSYDAVVYCGVCGEELSRETVTVYAPGHTESEAVTENETEATCTENGSYDSVVYCGVCGEELSRETVTVYAPGHSYAAAVTAPTCTDGGYTTYVCTRCGDSYVDDYTEAAGHTAGEAVLETVTPATCVSTGLADLVTRCSVCGEELDRISGVITDKTPHTPANPVIEETVITDDETGEETVIREQVVYCSECGKELKRTKWNKHVHEDADNNGHCDICGASPCPVCGQYHNTATVAGWVLSFMHDVIYVLTKMTAVFRAF